jgi:hypothetical protein
VFVDFTTRASKERIYQDATHHAGRKSEELRAVAPINALLVY